MVKTKIKIKKRQCMVFPCIKCVQGKCCYSHKCKIKYLKFGKVYIDDCPIKHNVRKCAKSRKH